MGKDAQPQSQSRRTVVLVACSARKAAEPCAAQDLYQGSLFKLARAYVEAAGLEWRILSAQYGVVAPTRVLHPYNLTLNAAEYRRKWSRETATTLRVLTFGDTEALRLIVLAGDNYGGWIREMQQPNPVQCGRVGRPDTTDDRYADPNGDDAYRFVSNPCPVYIETPLAGLGIGQQMARLKQMTKEAQKP